MTVKEEKKPYRSLTLDEIDRIFGLLGEAEAIFGVTSSLDTDDVDPYENGYITRLAYRGLDAVKEALDI